MAIHTTYSKARANLAKLFDHASENKEVVYISRRKAEDVALISTSELTGLLETAHLMRSPKNAQRLLTALNRALAETEPTQSVEDLKREIGFGEKE